MALHTNKTFYCDYTDYSVMGGLLNGGEMTLTSTPSYGGSMQFAGSTHTGFPWTGAPGATLDNSGFLWAYHWSATASGVKRYYIISVHANGAWYSAYPADVTVSKSNASSTTLGTSSGSDYNAQFRSNVSSILQSHGLLWEDVDNLRVVLWFDVPGGTFKMSDMRLNLRYTIPDYTVTASGTGGTVVGTYTDTDGVTSAFTSGGSYEYGGSITLTAIALSGYRFLRWSDGVTDVTRTVTVTGAASYTPVFEQHAGTHTRTFYFAGRSGSGLEDLKNGGEQTISTEESATFSIRTTGDGHFPWRNVSGSVINSIVWHFRGTAADAGSQAMFWHGYIRGTSSLNHYRPASGYTTETLLNPVINTDVDQTTELYDELTTNSHTAADVQQLRLYIVLTPPTGGSMTVSELGYIITYTLPTYAVTATAQTGGTVAGTYTDTEGSTSAFSSGGSYEHGGTITLTATASTGYVFTGWSDGVSTATRTVTVTGAASYTATFDKIPTITEFVIEESPVDDGTVTTGEGIIIKATIA